MIYFDYNATTAVASEVRVAMEPFLGPVFGNPSSVHAAGREARAALDDFRDRAAIVLGAKPSEIVFTSGGTESNNLALFGAARLRRSFGRHIVTSAIEHHAVLHPLDYLEKQEGFEVSRIRPGANGIVNVAEIIAAIRPDTVLVSVMAANNETGALQPVAEIGEACRARGVLFHTDAAQWIGKEPFRNVGQFNADLVSICAHKLHGPKGAGLLFIRSPLLPHPTLFGGGHENERRAGTENLPAIAGMVTALEMFAKNPAFRREDLEPLTNQIAECALNIRGVRLVSPPAKNRLSNTISFTVEGCDNIALMAGLDLEGVCASSGAACSAGSLEPSHVLVAMGCSRGESNSLVRFSLGRNSSKEEVKALEIILPRVVERLRRAG